MNDTQPRMLPARIVIVDNHAMFRQGLRKLFEEHPGFSIVGEASNCTEAIAIVQELALDILLIGLQPRDTTGFSSLQTVGRAANFKIILLGDLPREDEIKAILLGASGVVSKSAGYETLFKSMQSVLEGEIWAKRDLLKDLLAILINSRSRPVNRIGIH